MFVADAPTGLERSGILHTPDPSNQNHPRSKAYIFLLAMAVICFNAIGNLSLAIGMKRFPEDLGLNPLRFLQAMANPFVVAGIGLLILWMLTRMTLMSWADLSFILPVTGFGYVLAAVLGRVFLHEQISVRQWIGVFLISFGIAFVGTTAPETSKQTRASV